MRVVLIGNTIPPDAAGGLPRYVRELAAALARTGCEVLLLAKRVDAAAPRVETASDGVKIIRHAAPSKRNPFFAPAYAFYAAHGVLGPVRASASRETVIHAHFPVTALPLALGELPYLYTFHAPVWRELLDERQGTYALPAAVQRAAVAGVRAAERLVVRRARRTFVLSEFMRGQLGELSEATARAASLLVGGIDVEKFSPQAATAHAEVHSPLLFTARRLTPRTGVDGLLAAMPEILRAHPRTTLAVAGAGDMEGELQRLAARLGVADRVRFLGYVPDEALVEWYRRATLVVMPTVRLEGFGLTAAEALACGTPVVGTPVGALPELLEPLDAALLASDAGPQSLARTVLRLLADRDRLASIAARCRAYVAPAMGWEAIAARYLGAYEELASSQPLRGRPPLATGRGQVAPDRPRRSSSAR